jgi:TPR repeat protein
MAAESCKPGRSLRAHLLGLIRLQRNYYSDAAGWFRKVAMQGLPQAHAKLGELLKDGRGVAADKFEAYVWLLVSFDAGNQNVAADLATLEGELGSNRVDEAKSKARDIEQTASRAVVSHGCSGWPGPWCRIRLPRTSNASAAKRTWCGADTFVRRFDFDSLIQSSFTQFHQQPEAKNQFQRRGTRVSRLTRLRILRRLPVSCHRFQRGIKLHERMLDGSVILMTLPAGSFRIGRR